MLKNIQKYIKHVLNYTVCAVIKFYAHQIIIHSGETTFNSWFLVLENKKFKPRLKDFVPVDHPKPQKHLSQVVASGWARADWPASGAATGSHRSPGRLRSGVQSGRARTAHDNVALAWPGTTAGHKVRQQRPISWTSFLSLHQCSSLFYLFLIFVKLNAFEINMWDEIVWYVLWDELTRAANCRGSSQSRQGLAALAFFRTF